MSPRINLIGQKFGYVTVAGVSNLSVGGRRKWECSCDCGTICYFLTCKLNGKGRTPSCGCKTNLNKQLGHQNKSLETLKDLTGMKINNLTVKSFIGFIESNNNRFKSAPYWLVKCNCGLELKVRHYDLTKPKPMFSCINCSYKAKQTHGLSNLPEYSIYKGMLDRCYKPESKAFKYYGERGIKVCDRWLESPQHFIDDMGIRPSKDYSIERLNVNKDYSPENCIWLLFKEQARNTRRTVLNVDIVKELKELRSLNYTFTTAQTLLLSKYNNVTKQALYDVWRNKSWKSI